MHKMKFQLIQFLPFNIMKKLKHHENNDKACSSTCYLIHKSKKTPPTNIIKHILRIKKLFGNDPCIIYLSLSYLKIEVACADIYSLFLDSKNNFLHKQKPILYYRKILVNQDFQPCSHTGSCLNNTKCTCYANKTYCENSCQCESCNLVTYCTCKTCDASCPCILKSRECTCHETCSNRAIFMRKEMKTFISSSSTSGFGLFAGEDIENGTFIIEYVGEIISLLESERRGVFYDQKKISYLFGLRTNNEEMDTIDATRLGNNARFINHSKNANIVAKQILSNGMSKIGFYAKRNIKENEELFFDYKYNEQTKEMFHMTD